MNKYNKEFDRKLCLQALTGSHNYNLNDENSDKDYKYFVIPTIEDIYYNKNYSVVKTSKDEDFTVHDIRKLPMLLTKSNLNFIEILYSIDHVEEPELKQIFDMRNEIATADLPRLYSACVGMHYEKMKAIHKGTETTQILVEKFGYDTKGALHAYRCLDFLQRMVDNDFDFGRAIRYDDKNDFDDGHRMLMMAIKQGRITENTFDVIIRDKIKEIESIKPMFTEKEPNKEMYDILNKIIFNMVIGKGVFI